MVPFFFHILKSRNRRFSDSAKMYYFENKQVSFIVSSRGPFCDKKKKLSESLKYQRS